VFEIELLVQHKRSNGNSGKCTSKQEQRKHNRKVVKNQMIYHFKEDMKI
jgi:hypothetical protein